MRALLITAVMFFSVFGAGLTYFAISDSGHQYDLKFALPIDTRKMPKLGPLPEIVAQVPDETANPIADGRAEAGAPPPPRQLVRFPDRDGTASEAPSRE